ncbi:MAG: hypothetical protein ACE5KT_05170 [Methanosarcinales archaeon]
MTIKIIFSKPYYKHHEPFVPKSLVSEVIFTAKMKRKGKDLIEFKKRSKKQEIYVLCKEIEPGVLKVINAKKRRI